MAHNAIISNPAYYIIRTIRDDEKEEALLG